MKRLFKLSALNTCRGCLTGVTKSEPISFRLSGVCGIY